MPPCVFLNLSKSYYWSQHLVNFQNYLTEHAHASACGFYKTLFVTALYVGYLT